MTAAVAASPTTGVHLSTAFDVSCTGVANNDPVAYSTSAYPTEPQIAYYLKFSLAGQPDFKSNVFSTNPDGAAEWHGVILPAAGSWTLDCNLVSDNSTAATTSVVVA